MYYPTDLPQLKQQFIVKPIKLGFIHSSQKLSKSQVQLSSSFEITMDLVNSRVVNIVRNLSLRQLLGQCSYRSGILVTVITSFVHFLLNMNPAPPFTPLDVSRCSTGQVQVQLIFPYVHHVLFHDSSSVQICTFVSISTCHPHLL